MRSVLRSGTFGGKTAIVTGGGSGIGKAISTELAQLGCNVVIASRNMEKLQKAKTEIEEATTSGLISTIECNIRKEEEVKRLMDETVEKFGKIDFLVNNGGGQFISPAALIKTKGWHAVVETNLTGTFICCREAYRASMQKHGGSIVNIIADMWRGFPGMAHTGAARAAVANLTQTLAVEWAPQGVRVNSVAPGIIYSESAAQNYPDPKLLLGQGHRVPMKRVGTVEEVSGPVVFLLSPAAAYITGTILKVDGGSSLWGDMYDIPAHTNMPVWGSELPEGGFATPKPKM
eukprot:TRINITY_DN67539_c3_g1_i8.p1 TRINITY_DN67539_c3_g1~~TRINITY_DN67539_c3_g1_i8.p1  ORF type:complete len:300 (-),score=6.96 TRINITY_DN67539_c3_g1_i8:254-1120(-)